MKKLVKFTKSFGGKKKGNEGYYNSILASTLVHQKKVAKYIEPKS